MIVIDASALVAILLDEPERESLLRALAQSECRLSPIGYWEAATRLNHQRGAPGLNDLDRLIANFDIRIVAAGEAIAKSAVKAQVRFGKRTPAKLNLGDCFAYALARELEAPLLYKGDDFRQTDIRPALPV